MIPELVFMLILLISNTIQAITGFAGTMLAMPPSAMILGTDQAKAVLSLISLVACTVITIQTRKWMNKEILWLIIRYMLIGMVAGIVLYQLLPLDFLLLFYGVFIIAIALRTMFLSPIEDLSKKQSIVVLLTAGIIHGLFVSGGSLLVVYAGCKLKNKDEFRATLAPVWVVLELFMIIPNYLSGGLTSYSMTLAAVGLIPLAISILLGNILYKKVNQSSFLKICNILLIISGSLSIFDALG